MKLYGVDFTSAPTPRKPVTIAEGRYDGGVLSLEALHDLPSLPAFGAWLQRPGPWLAAFDLPFALPAGLLRFHGWPQAWEAQMRHLQGISRAALREACKAYCDSQPAGSKFAHRATDRLAGSSPSMKWVNPPVAYMLHEGAPRLLDAGLTIPGMWPGDPERIALEAYPGMVARGISRHSYKSDDRRRQTPERQRVREQIVQALEAGEHPWQVRCNWQHGRDALIADGSGDRLDAALCLMLAAWSWARRDERYGLPLFDPCEGWIAGCDVSAAVPAKAGI